jgi:hypothetical protein
MDKTYTVTRIGSTWLIEYDNKGQMIWDEPHLISFCATFNTAGYTPVTDWTKLFND